MYFDGDDNNIYEPEYSYEPETENLPFDCPLDCPYRQTVAFSPFQRSPQSGPPAAPPSFTPSPPQAQQFGATPMAIDQGAIRPCLFRLVYIWPRRGRGFWAWLTFVGRRSVSGFRWERNNWRYFGMDLRQISSFQCF